ncbi:MAG: hypothetical protein DRI90_12355 [Deltaproteobacteria bacterium]|nr:MAG: hypothetical protein DRI90_12355 [Deltaproteobacteria bacterium]
MVLLQVMHPLVKGACAAAVIAAIGRPTEVSSPAPDLSATPVAEATPALADPQQAGCKRRFLPLAAPSSGVRASGPLPSGLDHGAPRGPLFCVPLPPAKRAKTSARSRRLAIAPPSVSFLRTHGPRELIPRLPDRPEPFADYQLPVDPVLSVTTPGAASAASDAQPDDRLGITIEAEPAAPVTLVDLEGHSGQPEVVLVGQLVGVTVVVRQQVQGPAGPRSYLVIYGNLNRPGPRIVNGARLGAMEVIGTLGDDDEQAHLYLEIRLERGALDRPTEHLSQLVSSGVSVAVDPRNVLPLRR